MVVYFQLNSVKYPLSKIDDYGKDDESEAVCIFSMILCRLELKQVLITEKNKSKPYDGLLMVFLLVCQKFWFLKPELLTNRHMVFVKSDGFLLVFH